MTDEKKDLEAASKPPATIAEFFPTSLEELGINEKQLAFFKRTIAPALLDSEIVYLFIRAKKLGLDPIKSEICCIPHNTKIKKVGGGEEWVRVPTIIVEIGGLRKLAAERGRYIPGSVFLNTDNENNVHSATANCSFLAADGKWHPACYTVYMKEAMDAESPTWKRRPYGQLMKCAEAALIRYLSKVLDTDLSGVYEEAETAFINYEPHPKIEDKTDVFNALKSHHILPEMVCKKFGKASEEEMTKTDMLALKQVLAKIRIGEIDPIEYFGMIDMPQPEPAPEPPAEPEDVPAPMNGDYPPNHIPPDTTGMAEEIKKHIASFPPEPPQESQPQVATTSPEPIDRVYESHHFLPLSEKGRETRKMIIDILDKVGEKMGGLTHGEVVSVITKGLFNEFDDTATMMDTEQAMMILDYGEKKGYVKKRIKMITEKQLETHKTLLGSSEIAAVMGLNPYQTAYDIWAVKTDKVLPVADRDEMTIGRVFEAGILDLFSREKDVIITTEAKKLEFIDNDFKLVSHPDALVIKELNALLTPAQQIFVSYLPVEAKAVGFKNLRMLDGWGKTEDEIPPMYQMQCQVHLICTGKDLCYLAAMLAGRGLVIYEIHPHPVFQDLIKEAAVNFFERYVIPDIPPPDSVPTEDTIKRLRRVPNKTVSVPADIFRDYRDQNEQLKVLEKYVEEAKRKLLALLGDAEGAVCDDPTLGGFTYFQYDRTSLDTHALKNEQPEIWQKYQRTGSFRRLNLKKKMER